MSGVPYAFLDEDFKYCLQDVLHLGPGIQSVSSSKIVLPFPNSSGCHLLTIHVACALESDSKPFRCGIVICCFACPCS